MNPIVLLSLCVDAIFVAPVKGLSPAAQDLLNKRNAVFSDIKRRKDAECRKYSKEIVEEVLREDKKLLDFYDFLKRAPKGGYKVPRTYVHKASLPLWKAFYALNFEQVNKLNVLQSSVSVAVYSEVFFYEEAQKKG